MGGKKRSKQGSSSSIEEEGTIRSDNVQMLKNFIDCLKVQLTPKNFFRLYKSPCFSDHRWEKIIVVTIFVNFLWFFKVPKFGVYVPHGRAIAKNGASWPVMSSKD